MGWYIAHGWGGAHPFVPPLSLLLRPVDSALLTTYRANTSRAKRSRGDCFDSFNAKDISLETQFLFSPRAFQFRSVIMYFQVSTGFWKENLREKDHLGDIGVDGRIILRWTLTFRNLASYIYRTGVKLPSRCPILYLFNKYPFWIF